MSKPAKATKYIRKSANRCRNAGITIDWDMRYPTVCISCPSEDDIFMQGEDAETFVAEIKATCKRLPSLDEYTCALAMSGEYAECIWGNIMTNKYRVDRAESLRVAYGVILSIWDNDAHDYIIKMQKGLT